MKVRAVAVGKVPNFFCDLGLFPRGAIPLSDPAGGDLAESCLAVQRSWRSRSELRIKIGAGFGCHLTVRSLANVDSIQHEELPATGLALDATDHRRLVVTF